MQATKILMDEHQTILRVLASLERLVADDAHANEPAETFAAVVDFLRSYADRLHHGKEEALLFPAMEARGMSPEQGPTAVMRYEHEIGRGLVRQMAQLAQSEPFDRAAYAKPALQFVQMLRAHIAKEDQILFPMAERMLGGADASQLAAAYEKVEERDFPADIHARHESWARELAQRVGVDRERFDLPPACHAPSH